MIELKVTNPNDPFSYAFGMNFGGSGAYIKFQEVEIEINGERFVHESVLKGCDWCDQYENDVDVKTNPVSVDDFAVGDVVEIVERESFDCPAIGERGVIVTPVPYEGGGFGVRFDKSFIAAHRLLNTIDEARGRWYGGNNENLHCIRKVN